MLRVFALKNTAFDDDGKFQKYLALTDGERREKVASLVSREKQNESLAAGVILPLALKACGFAGEIKTELGQWNKPRLVTPKGVNFNLSHSGEWTVVAVSDSEVGCDIERIRDVDLSVADRFFHEEERRQIAAAGDGARLLFFRYWVAKESYLKALGTGLNRPLNGFCVHLQDGGRVTDPLGGGSWRIAESGALEGYRLACCTESGESFEVEVLKA